MSIAKRIYWMARTWYWRSRFVQSCQNNLGRHTRNEENLYRALKLLERSLPYVQEHATMMGDLTRHAPLMAQDQALHDNTEYDSERLVGEIPQFIAKAKKEAKA